MGGFKTLDDIGDVTGKRVLVRVDLNVPMADGAVADDTRIRAALPTIRELSDKGAIVLLLAHFGRPKGAKNPTQSLSLVIDGVADVLGHSVRFIPNWVAEGARAGGPVLAPGDVRLSRPDAGSSNVCANGSDGRVYCWGDNFGGKVGIGGGPLTVSTPTAISAPAGVSFSDVSVGGTVSCAMSVNGRPFCWGVNAAGQVGDGTRTNRSAPVPVVEVRGA